MKLNAEKAIQNRLILIHGPDDGQRRTALSEVLKAAGLQPDDLDLESFPADQKSPLEWLGLAGTPPFLADRRTVVVRNLGRVDPADTWPDTPIKKGHIFAEQASSLPESGLLILVQDDEGGDANKAQRTETVVKKWGRLVEMAGGLALEMKSDPAQTVKSIGVRCQEEGYKISRSAAEHLSERVGGRERQALDELEKLFAYTRDSLTIRTEDIDELVMPDIEYGIFALVDAVAQGRGKEALGQLQRLLAQHPKAEGEAFSRVFPMFQRQFRLIWIARLCLETKSNLDRPSREAQAHMPSNPPIAKLWPRQKQALMTSAKRLTFEQIGACLHAIGDADARIKGLKPSYSTRETLEQLVLGLAQICRAV